MENNSHIVIDNGTGLIKAGFSGEEAPKAVFPTICGRPKVPGILIGGEKREIFVGQEALEKRGILNLNSPIVEGQIENWDDMEKIWHHTFYNELKKQPEENNVMLTEVPLNYKTNRETTTQIMFERFNVPGMYITVQAISSLYSTGKTTGVIIDSGHGSTHCVPIFEGYAFPHAILKTPIGGKDLTDYFMKILVEKGFNFFSQGEKELLKKIKEEACYISMDYDKDLKECTKNGSADMKYELPDGNEIVLGTERFRCPEILFKPNLLGSEHIGIHETCYQSIMKSDMDIRKDFYSNIILTGGNSMFDMFPQRLCKEIQKLAPSTSSSSVKVIALPERNYSAWIGASILSSLGNFQIMWITKSEYDDAGPQIVHRKCF
jgi:actin